ncbi:MAG: RraA family protein [Thermogemmata sp.]|jgi:regulator of RNase E activity RraA|uniref:Putative 4-hydroxy-4-methyl-2-oxoglutarate aldolase n=1 Tax=Thermogemmata fonticola TaxID=2755323 RepID=A0A7V8VDQ8_9BACT|nr:RraA family protein [Thermogemmata fonticola]MBA2226066.1 RraA family protein [Thermogemmata fonticola]MCX8141112.1 RraA family protein [Gemmataceae bacterium]
MRVPEDVLNRLRQFDTPTICNVLELFDYRPRTAGYMDSRIRACFPQLPPMVGFATTATFRAAAPPRSGDTYMGLSEQVERIAALDGPKVVVFQDLDDPPVAATFGEVMCTTYKAFGCVGIITSGAGRDLDQIEKLQFPCFTSGTICSHGYTQIVALDCPVRVGGVWVHPGDLLHGDRNGVTTIPLELAGWVADACPEFLAAEAVILEYLQAGHVTPAGFAKARDECKRRIHELGKKLRDHAARLQIL